MKILIINTGSASKKYALYEGDKQIYSAHFEHAADGPIVTEVFTVGDGTEEKVTTPISDRVFDRALLRLLDSVREKKIITSPADVGAIGIRIVAPGDYFLTHKIIDKEYLKMVKQALDKVPLHLSPALEEIKLAQKIFSTIPLAGVSDSAFHRDLPTKAKYYAVPLSDSRRFNLQKFGYHGLSLQSVLNQTEKKLGQLPARIIICHLGGGASITAIKDGHSVETSMGFTPLDGLVMATRVGEIDPGAVIYLADQLGLKGSRLGEYFNNQCGLLGLSGKSSDVRDLLKLEQAGDKDSTLALEIYVNRLKKYIGAMSAVLGGLDLLVFAGTVGERSFVMRERICADLDFLGLTLNLEKNNQSEGVAADISGESSRVKVLVAKTDELGEMAAATARLVSLSAAEPVL